MAKQTKQKGKKMIKNIRCFKHGALGQQDLEELRGYLRCKISDATIQFDGDSHGVVKDCYYGWLNINLFDKECIAINGKNIEYQEKFYLIDGGGNYAELDQAMKHRKIEEVGIELIIYRIGSYSYYAAICEAYSPDHPQIG